MTDLEKARDRLRIIAQSLTALKRDIDDDYEIDNGAIVVERLMDGGLILDEALALLTEEVHFYKWAHQKMKFE